MTVKQRRARTVVLLSTILGAIGVSGLGGCQTGDATRASLEYHDQLVAPRFAVSDVVLSSAPVEGQGAPYAQITDARE